MRDVLLSLCCLPFTIGVPIAIVKGWFSEGACADNPEHEGEEDVL